MGPHRGLNLRVGRGCLSVWDWDQGHWLELTGECQTFWSFNNGSMASTGAVFVAAGTKLFSGRPRDKNIKSGHVILTTSRGA